jgi:hypothetical protein
MLAMLPPAAAGSPVCDRVACALCPQKQVSYINKAKEIKAVSISNVLFYGCDL